MLLIRLKDIELAKKFIGIFGLSKSDYFLLNVPHENVNAYLNAADMGILLRDDLILNKASCPGKLGEYLGAGLDVVTTPYIGMYSDALIKSNIGLIIDDFRDLQKFSTMFKSYSRIRTREEISIWAQKNFSSNSFAKDYFYFLSYF